ncbi:MAG TPA: hypothetical protein VJ742_12730 [Nitrososphaera sp.]|nr:hypothetical protein [Nitrososphaera sp.]
MIVGLLALLACFILGFFVYWADEDLAGAVRMTAIFVIGVLACWIVVAWLWSPYQKNICQGKAEGYKLEDSDWSFRYDCRVKLSSGQWVPEERIRITTDGQIVVTDD